MFPPCFARQIIAMLAFRVIFTGAAIGTLILVAVHQRALRPAEVASLEQPYEAPALESDRLDGLVKLREQMMQALPRPQPEAAPEPAESELWTDVLVGA